MKLHRFFAAAFLVAVLFVSGITNASLLSQDDILQFEFSFNPTPAPLEEDAFTYANPDFSQPAITVLAGLSSPITHKLYDEDVLLGSYTQTKGINANFSAFWTTSESLFTFLNPTVVDLSTIEDGTTNGRIEIRLTSGLLDIDLANLSFQPEFFEATDFNSGAFSHKPVITNASIISTIPIPAAAWLFGTGLIGLIGLARRKQSS